MRVVRQARSPAPRRGLSCAPWFAVLTLALGACSFADEAPGAPVLGRGVDAYEDGRQSSDRARERSTTGSRNRAGAGGRAGSTAGSGGRGGRDGEAGEAPRPAGEGGASSRAGSGAAGEAGAASLPPAEPDAGVTPDSGAAAAGPSDPSSEPDAGRAADPGDVIDPGPSAAPPEGDDGAAEHDDEDESGDADDDPRDDAEQDGEERGDPRERSAEDDFFGALIALISSIVQLEPIEATSQLLALLSAATGLDPEALGGLILFIDDAQLCAGDPLLCEVACGLIEGRCSVCADQDACREAMDRTCHGLIGDCR